MVLLMSLFKLFNYPDFHLMELFLEHEVACKSFVVLVFKVMTLVQDRVVNFIYFCTYILKTTSFFLKFLDSLSLDCVNFVNVIVRVTTDVTFVNK